MTTTQIGALAATGLLWAATATTEPVSTEPADGGALQESGGCDGVDIDQIGYSPLTMEFDYFRFTVQGMEAAG
ncbi:hypothetical protein BH24ACT5_BH24ACT5_05730 [soil metagenome]